MDDDIVARITFRKKVVMPKQKHWSKRIRKVKPLMLNPKPAVYKQLSDRRSPRRKYPTEDVPAIIENAISTMGLTGWRY